MGLTFPFRRPPVVGKVDLIHYFADRYRLRRYLEFASITTGHHYADIDRSRFDLCERLMYRCGEGPPEGPSDGCAVDYRSPDMDVTEPLARIAANGRTYDIMLVDPYHGYGTSYRDIEAAFGLLEDGGVMVVHDCLPPSRELASPTFIPDHWCGETYRAYLNFVFDRVDVRYLTVDTDYGCGIIRKSSPKRAAGLSRIVEALNYPPAVRWHRARRDVDAAWRVFAAHRRSLLRLVRPEVVLANRHGLD